MKRQEAENIIAKYLKPVFGFALKRTRCIQDAEDLSQEIALRAFRAMISKDDIVDTEKFIWTVAHNALSNYYRDNAKIHVGVSVDEIAELIADPQYGDEDNDNAESLSRLGGEIAYLSKLQRRIVIAYYFENKKQADIANGLGIPLGTVKWHLFEARKELKKGMETMRKASELKFNPVKLHYIGINGSPGTKSVNDIFRSSLTQNICYCVRNSAKTVAEIADDLGVSPVYVEGEAEFLAEYGFLKEEKGRYIVNFLINEPCAELLTMKDMMYKTAAKIFSDELYDELCASGILDNDGIVCGREDGDRNFILWSLIPYIAARSGEELMGESISFEEVATVRPDGAHNICCATVVQPDMKLPDDYVYMHNWCGPMWNESAENLHWQIDSEWSDRRDLFDEVRYPSDISKVLSLYERSKSEQLSKDEYAYLAQRGYIKTYGDSDGLFKAEWQIVILSADINKRLLSIGDKIKEKCKDKFEALKAAYVEAELKAYPPHMAKAVRFEQQCIFSSDGWFLLHCIKALLASGKLSEPTEEQRKALTTLIIKK